MNKQTYYTILENVGIRNNITNMIKVLDDIMETYDSSGIRRMTLEEAKDFLWDRYAVFTKKIESELDVK
jgi:hypothetical protein